MKTTIGLCVVGLLASPVAQLEVMACLNTSYSRVEETQMTEDLTKILSGQLSEHGEEFYRAQKQKLERELNEDPYDIELRNDLGAAEIKLRNYDAALKQFELIEGLEPGRYKTHANLGVLFKKIGDYEKAAEHTRNALAIKPEGHLGLGDYYLRMLESRANRKAGIAGADARNFLGTRYSEGPLAAAANPLTNREHLITLIKADRHYVDAHIVLGDVLFAEGDLQNAVRAYGKAQSMLTSADTQHPILRERMETILERWKEEDGSGGTPGYVYHSQVPLQLHREREAADVWVTRFQQIESEMLQSGVADVSIGSVKSEMARLNVPEPRYYEAGHFKVRPSASHLIEIGVVLIVLVVAPLLAAIVLVKLMRRARRRHAGG